MFTIVPKETTEGQQINITGGRLPYKFSIHENRGEYLATSSKTNIELTRLLDGLDYLSNKRFDGGYYWWKVAPSRIISLQNSVMNHFKK